jgi:hypothetical protein
MSIPVSTGGTEAKEDKSRLDGLREDKALPCIWPGWWILRRIRYDLPPVWRIDKVDKGTPADRTTCGIDVLRRLPDDLFLQGRFFSHEGPTEAQLLRCRRCIESVIADYLRMGCGDVEEIPLDEFSNGKGHGLRFGSVAILVGKGHGLIRRRGDPAVRHGPASDITGQVDEDTFAVIITGFYVDIPFLPTELVPQVFPLLERHAQRKSDGTFHDGIVHVSKELSPEYEHDRGDGEKVAFMTCFFPFSLTEAAFSDEAVEVKMKRHGLGPGMKRGNDTGLGSDMLRVLEELKEGISHAGEKEVRHIPYIQKPDVVEIMRYGENHVVMATGKKTLFLSLQPFGDPHPLALRAEAMAAGVVPVSLVVAFGACFHMTAQFSGSAYHEGTGSFSDMIRKSVDLLIGRICRSHNLLDCRMSHEPTLMRDKLSG